jgi:hypothetical protein
LCLCLNEKFKHPDQRRTNETEAIDKNRPAGVEEAVTAEEERAQNGSIARIPSDRMMKRDILE